MQRIRIAEYLKSLIRANTLDSSKSFALVLSILVGAFIGLCVGFALYGMYAPTAI